MRTRRERGRGLSLALAAAAGATAGLYGCLLITQAPPAEKTMQELYRNYTHIVMHEDGSIQGETIDGKPFAHCITNALCEEKE